MRRLLIAAIIGAVTGAAAVATFSAQATAGGSRYEDSRVRIRDCTPINGPYGYYGNPWCDGWKGDAGRPLRLRLPGWLDDNPSRTIETQRYLRR